MANRTVKVDLVAGTPGFTAPMKEAAASALKVDLALKQQAATAKQAGLETVKAAQQTAIAEKQSALAAAEAAAKNVTGDEAQVAAKKEVEAASKQLAVQEKSSAVAIAAAQKETAAASKEAVAAQKALQDEAKRTSEAYTNTGKKFMTAGTVMLAGFAVAMKASSDFTKSMSGVEAVANASATQMGQLSGAALQAGKDTAFTATQAADAEDELVKAGVSVADVLGGGLKGSLSLAAAGNLDLAQSATIASNEMNTFGLKGKDVGHIADVLAAGANKSAADVGELANGMSQGGLVAHQMGLTLEDTTATLSAFADEGLHGADAGTSMKTMLERLAAPTTAAADQMKALGITTYDASGNFVGIVKMAGELNDKLGPLTQQQRNLALQTIFGSDAIRAATVLYNQGAAGMQGYVDSVNDSGAASRMAGTQMNNLSGDLKQLKGSLDVALIQSGTGANSVLRDLTQGATKAVNTFASLPKPVQEAAAAFAGAGGSTLLLVGGITTAAGKIGNLRKGLQEAETTAEGFKGGMAKVGSFLTGPWGLALVGAATVASIFISKMGDAKVQVTDFTAAIKDDGNALGANSSAAVAADLAHRGLYDSLGKLGVGMDTVTKAAMGNSDALQAVEQATAKAIKSGGALNSAGAVKDLQTIEATAAGLHDQQKAQLQATAATQAAADAATDDASVQARLAESSKQAAAGTMQRAAAARAAADASRAEASGDTSVAAAAKGSTSAKSNSTKATKDATAATKADEAAARAHASAQKASNTATNDASKAAAANAKAQSSAASATDNNSYANSTAAGKAKEATSATKAQTQAQDANTRSANAGISASQAAARAHDADTKAATAHAKATSDAAKAAAGDAQAQADAAEAARQAAFTHQIGTEALKGWAAAAADTSHSTDVLDDSVTAEVAAMKDAQNVASGLKDAMDALNGVHISAGKAAVDVQQKTADLTKALHDNGNSLDITTQKGRDNMNSIYDLASAIQAHAEAVTQETGSVDAGNKSLQASKDEFDKVLGAAGVSKTAIQQFNDELLAIPATKPVTITVDSAEALNKIQSFMKVVDGEAQIVAVHIGGTTGKAALATGGLVQGPGTETSDSVPIQASRGEYMLRAAAVRRIGVDNLNRLNFGGAVPTFVRPQLVGAVGGTSQHAAGAAAGVALQLSVDGAGANAGVASLISYLFRTGAIKIKGVNA